MREFIVLMAFLTSLAALSVDAMLPALEQIGVDLEVARANSVQLVITVLFAGMMAGYLIYGPVADAWGRKPALNLGLGLYILGSLICCLSPSLTVLLLGRFVQGLGAAGGRIVTIAIVRDTFSGREMARVMSFIMGIFILVPIVAPALGQAVLAVASWRAMFGFFIVAALVAGFWAFFRLTETLPPDQAKPLKFLALVDGFKEAAGTRVTLGYAVTSGICFGAIIGYLNSIQQILQDIYHAGPLFALYFGMMAAMIGGASFVNSALVQRLGMRRLIRLALLGMIGLSLLFLPLAVQVSVVPLPVFLAYAGLSFFCLGLMFGNMSALAMEPMGHIAGSASAFVSFVSTGVAIACGFLIGQLYDGTVVPLAGGYLVLSVGALLVMSLTENCQNQEH
ncbi:MAG: multidrug effflux MFS transporter [Alphaproteobacteria bacterium]|nr:multidrug effflux MFS transporter [Alphaproteobacteria bacterium]MBP7759129.1 multidrug effflux MFS transporter [Alphaproteobacteria bacterium]MBP7762493.1 multidrug effflux MFS transporter [Alphaproteobacteria bacterium]